MARRLHLICGESGAATLRLALSDSCRHDQILVFPNILQYGLLPTAFDEEPVRKYVDSCRDMFLMGKSECEGVVEAILSFSNFDFSGYDDIILWHGDTVGDTLFYYMVCYMLSVELHEVCINRIRPMLPNPNTSVSLTICSVDNIKVLLYSIAKIPQNNQVHAARMWQRWIESPSELRVSTQCGEIIGVSKDFLDEIIIKTCGREWRSAARVVGEILCDTGFIVGDNFLHNRMICLARCGALSVRRNVKSFTDMACNIEGSRDPILVDGVDVGQLRLFEVSV
ncbi:MAG: DUF1835 domain-containing protein [Alistipes sp.]|nr:DUF1835 domain-containing protein [Alistipes sp.]